MVDTVGAPVEADPAEVAANVAADAADDAVLDRIVGVDTAEPVPATQDAAPALTDGRARDATGKFTSKKSETPAQSTQESEPTATPTNGANTDEYRQAVRALQRDNVPHGVLDSMEPEAVIAWGTERAKTQLDVDRINSKNAELERAITLVQGKSEATVEDKPSTVDIDDVLGEFSDFFGDEAAEPLRKFGEAIVKQVQSGLGDQREQLQEILGRMQAQDQTEARKALADRYSLSDEQRWQAVQAYMAKDANTHSTASEAVLSACRQLFADEPHPDQIAAEHNARDNGQPTTEHRAIPPAAEPTLDGLEDLLIDAIEDGDTEEHDRIQRELRRRTAVPLMLEGRVGVK